MRPELKQLGDTMLRFGKALFPRGYVKDVYAWETSDNSVRWAWVMEPEKLRRAVALGLIDGEYETGRLPFQWEYVQYALREAGIEGFDGFSWDRGPASVTEFVMKMPNLGGHVLGWGEPYEDFAATFIPEPGYPWPHDYYSAKKGRMQDGGKRPPWLLPEPIVDAAHALNSPGVDFCELIGPLEGYEAGGEVAAWGRSDYFVVTHAMGSMDNVTRQGSWADNAAHINSCGGLLFPSLAVGQIPATNFGPFVMVADVGAVLRSLKPNMRKGQQPPTFVYDTDVWSMTTGTFYREGAISAFEQLTGDSEWMYYLDMNVWPLGSPQAPELHGPGVASRLTRVTQLKREVKDRGRVYYRGLGPEEAQEIFEREAVSTSKLRYPYLEAKANGVMPMSSFPMAVAPAQAVDGFRNFLADVGFTGRLVTVDLPDEIAEVMAPEWRPADMDIHQKLAVQGWANLEYGWHVADAIREQGEEVRA